MRLQHGSAITLTLLASSLQLVAVSGQGPQADYSSDVSGYKPQPRPDYPSRPASQPAPPPMSQKPAPPPPAQTPQRQQPEPNPAPTPQRPSSQPSPRPSQDPSQKPSESPSGGNATMASAQAKPQPKTQSTGIRPEDGPPLDVNDPRFQNFKPAGDARSACPGLNSLANHGFLPHDGRQINATDIVLACYHGLGMSPETCSIIALSGLVESDNALDLVFNLEDVDLESWGIGHDCSFSRKDKSTSNKFNKAVWDVALAELNNCQQGGKVSARCLGRARAARIKDQKKSNPATNYDDKAAGHGAVEVARMILTLGNKQDGADLGFIRSIFEEEKLPSHLGWKPQPYTAGVLDVLDVAEDSQGAEPETLANTSQGDISNRIDIMTTLKSKKQDFLKEVKKLCVQSGFRKQSVYDSLKTLDEEVIDRFGEDFETRIDADPNNV